MNLDHLIPGPLLQTALRNHALEARKRRGRFREDGKEKTSGLKSPVVERRPRPLPPIPVNRPLSEPVALELTVPSDEEETSEGLFSSTSAADLRRNRHIRRGRRPTRLLDKQNADPTGVLRFPDASMEQLAYLTRSAPIRLTPEVNPGHERFSQTAPLRVAPKLSINSRTGHARSLSAPENITPIDSPGVDSILLFYDTVRTPSPFGEFSSGDSDDESVHSAMSEPPSTTVELSTNMFLVRGDSIDSWPTEFPVEALEDEHEVPPDAGAVELRRQKTEIGALGLKRQNTEVIVQLLQDRRQRAEQAMWAARPVTADDAELPLPL